MIVGSALIALSTTCVANLQEPQIDSPKLNVKVLSPAKLHELETDTLRIAQILRMPNIGRMIGYETSDVGAGIRGDFRFEGRYHVTSKISDGLVNSIDGPRDFGSFSATEYHQRGECPFDSKENIIGNAFALARKIGSKERLELRDFTETTDEDGSLSSSRQQGYWRGRITVELGTREHGYPVPMKKIGFSFDRWTGECLSFYQRWDVEVVAFAKVLTQEQAIAKAKAYLASAESVGDPRKKEIAKRKTPGEPLRKADIKLGYVFETYYYGNTPKNFDEIWKVRPYQSIACPEEGKWKLYLAYQVPFGGDVVYVDAGNGRLLGGTWDQDFLRLYYREAQRRRQEAEAQRDRSGQVPSKSMPPETGENTP